MDIFESLGKTFVKRRKVIVYIYTEIQVKVSDYGRRDKDRHKESINCKDPRVSPCYDFFF